MGALKVAATAQGLVSYFDYYLENEMVNLMGVVMVHCLMSG